MVPKEKRVFESESCFSPDRQNSDAGMPDTSLKFKTLQSILKEMGSVCAAFSGGVDSAFLLKIACNVLKNNVLAVTAASPIHPAFEIENAQNLAKQFGVRHIMVESDELKLDAFVQNPPDRCYICKKQIFSNLQRIANENGIKQVIDGSNVDDEGDYRPGMKALRELGIRSPLREAGLTKQEIRELSKEVGLPAWNQPSMACLASRIPYGQPITKEALKRVEISEHNLRSLGFNQVRVRDHGLVARIEITQDQQQLLNDEKLSAEIVSALKKAGYRYVTLDLEGYRTGSLNEVLCQNEQGTD